MGQFFADFPMIFPLRVDDHGLFQHFTISHHAEEGKLTGDGRRKVVEQSAPLIEDGVLFLTGSQPVVDVLKTNGFGEVPIRHHADAIPVHALIRDGLLGRLRPVLGSVPSNDGVNLLSFRARELSCGRRFGFACRGQCGEPPFLPESVWQSGHKRFRSDTDGFWGADNGSG